MVYYPLKEMCQNLCKFAKHHSDNADLLDSDYDFIKNLEAMAFDYLDYHNIREEELHSFNGNFDSERLENNVEPNYRDSYYDDTELNYDYVRNGFSVFIHYSQLPSIECEAGLDMSKQTIQSPKYPDSYDNNLACKWLISVPHGSHITLKFLLLEVGFLVISISDSFS